MKTRNTFCNHLGKPTVENKIIESQFKVRIWEIFPGQNSINSLKNTSKKKNELDFLLVCVVDP